MAEITPADLDAARAGLREAGSLSEDSGDDSERTAGRLKNIEKAAVELGRRIDGVQIFGLHLTDFFSGMAIGWTSRNLARGALIAATGGVGYGGAMIAGGVAGAITATAREYFKQVRENFKEESATPELSGRKISLKEKLQSINKKQLAIAAGKGVIIGAVGGVAGSYIIEHGGEWVDYLRHSGENQPSSPTHLKTVQELFQSPENPAATAVGAHLELTNEITDQVLAEAKIDPRYLSSEAYEKIRLGVQHKMETWSNTNFEDVAAKAPPGTSTDQVLQQARNQLDNSWNRDDVIQSLKDGAKQELNQQTVIHHQIIEQINNRLTPGSFTDVVIQPGSNVGQLLVNHGHQITWGPADAEIFGAHIAVNHDLLTQTWGQMAATNHWPADFHYPIELGDLKNIIDQAKAGDPIALQKLKDALHWIPAGKTFRILNTEQISIVLANARLK